MASPVQEARSIDHFFSAPSGRTDRWRDLHAVARSWSKGGRNRAVVEAAFDELGVIEEFHAFPGAELLAALRGFLENDDASGFLSLAKRISLAIITGNYKHDAKEWQSADLSLAEPVDIAPSSLGESAGYRPYFEMLAVTPAPAGRWPHVAAEFRRLRRPEDAFVYETVLVGSLEDAVCAAVLNANIAAVAIYEGFALRSRHDAPILRSVLAAQQPFLDGGDEADLALRLAAPVADAGGHRFGGITANVGDKDIRPLVGQKPGRGRAHAAAGAGDQDRLALYPVHCPSSFPCRLLLRQQSAARAAAQHGMPMDRESLWMA